jgi:hypothetical protein
MDLEPSIAPLVRQQARRSLEQGEPGPKVLPNDRPITCDGESVAGPGAELADVGLSEFLPVTTGLLEVVAEQLVELDERGASLLYTSPRPRDTR